MTVTPVGALPPGQDRAALIAEVRRVLDTTVPDALLPGAPALLAVSGGPDSVALAHLVSEARPDLDAHVAHVRHGLREDAEDASVAADHAQALGLAYHERAVDVRPAGEGLEAAARDARYAALARVAREVGARAILVGHTADDQAETMLLNVARGAGLRGLAGMPVARPHADDLSADDPAVAEPASGEGPTVGMWVIRPLLRLRREDVRAFVEGEGLRTVDDPTNRDPRQRRTRARHDLLPRLAALSGGPGDPVGALTRLGDLARDDAQALDDLAAASARRLVVAWGPARAVETDALARLPDALARRVVRLFLQGVRGDVEASATTVAAVLALQPGQALHASGGVWVTCGGGWIAAVPPDTRPLAERPLPVPGSTGLPELGMVVRTAGARPAPPAAGTGGRGSSSGERGESGETPSGALAAGPPGSPRPPWALLRIRGETRLVVRGRRSGDRLAGARLTDALSAAGVPRAVRDLVPVVADASGQVLWVAGLAVADAGGADDPGPPGVAVVRVSLLPAGEGGQPTVV